jgi:hypothetical protein
MAQPERRVISDAAPMFSNLVRPDLSEPGILEIDAPERDAIACVST